MRNAIILALALAAGAAHAQYQPWDTVGIATGADLNIPVPADGRTRDFRSWDNERGLRWGRVEVEPSGDWRTWDNERGLRWGRIEVEQ
jgi:hypothetical protein